MPKKAIPRRGRSPLAQCACGKKLQLWVTRSPIPMYDYLVVERCPAHICMAQGVELDYSLDRDK